MICHSAAISWASSTISPCCVRCCSAALVARLTGGLPARGFGGPRAQLGEERAAHRAAPVRPHAGPLFLPQPNQFQDHITVGWEDAGLPELNPPVRLRRRGGRGRVGPSDAVLAIY